MRIAFYSDSYSPYVSGVVRSLQRFTKGLVQQGHEVYIFAPFYYGKKFKKGIEQHSDPYATKVFRFYSVPAPTCPSYFLPIPITIHSERLLQRLNIDIIHTHSPFLTGQLGAILARRLQVPLIFTHHTMYHEYLHYFPAPRMITKSSAIKFLQWYCRQCNHIITPSNLVRNVVRDFYRVPTPTTTIPTGIDLEPYGTANPDWLKNLLKLPKEAQIILSLGRLSKEKSPQILLKAFATIHELLPNSHFVFAGDGPQREQLEKQAKHLGLGSFVHFTGKLDSNEVVNAYSGADLFMLASKSETQGLVTIEAMAAGLPVVAVNASGTNEAVVDGKTGFLTGANPQDLAEYALRVLKEPALQARFRAAALKHVQSYSIERTSQRLVELYEQEIAHHLQPIS